MTERLSFALGSIETLNSTGRLSVVASFIEALTEVNAVYLRTIDVLPIYDSGVVYTLAEEWRDVSEVMLRGGGDCRSLVAWRLAEVRREGKRAHVHMIARGVGRRTDVHAVIRYGDGSIEDPSMILGMPPFL